MQTALAQATILIILPERLGDALTYTPCIALLKHYYPDCSLSALCLSNLSANMLSNNSAITHIMIKPGWLQCKRLARQYHYAFILGKERHMSWYQKQLKSIAVTIPEVHAHTHLAIQRLTFLSQWLNKPIPNKIQRYHLFPQDSDTRYIQQLLGLTTKHPLIGLHLGCYRIAQRRFLAWRQVNKRQHEKVWALDNFITLAKKITQRYPNVRLIVTGAKAEQTLANEFCRQIPQAINLVNQTNIMQFKRINVIVHPVYCLGYGYRSCCSCYANPFHHLISALSLSTILCLSTACYLC